MAKLGSGSLAKLATCTRMLQEFVHDLVEEYPADEDIRVECGHRDEADQNDAFERKTSQVPWPRSHHNTFPSKAVDLTPWPSRWSDVEKQKVLRERALALIKRKGYPIRIISWDLPHFEEI